MLYPVLWAPNITSELSEMFEKSHKLADEIRKKLGRLSIECKLEDIVDVTMGQSSKSECHNTEGKGYPFLQ